MVISQVYGAGGNSASSPWKRDFIELFNRGSTTVSLNGWSVQYANTQSQTWQITTLSGTLAPGQHYLVQEGASNGYGANLPPPNSANTVLMNGTLGKVALVSGTASISGLCPVDLPSVVDFVGYGTDVICYEGSSPTGNLSDAVAVVRNNGGCSDNNNNGANFTVQSASSPGPRNKTAPLAPCP